MANKRKQDEKHLKMLREMAALPHNKHCFDCNQRGPTYVNMTIGAFICTACSGTVRGLNPPYRVKSISMASFVTEEMEFLKSRGNEFCRKVYLGLYDARTSIEPNTKDEQKLRDFMSHKYEKKRWYVAPTEGFHEEARRMNSIEKVPESKPARNTGLNTCQGVTSQTRTLPSISAPPSSTVQLNSHQIKKAINLISDTQDPFHEPQPEDSPTKCTISKENITSSNGSSVYEANFANFDAFNEKGTTNTSIIQTIQPQNFLETKNTNNLLSQVKPIMGSGDKYAALAALDNELSSTSSVSWCGSGSSNYNTPCSSAFGNFPQNTVPFPASNSAPGGFGSSTTGTSLFGTTSSNPNPSPSPFSTTNNNPFNSNPMPQGSALQNPNPFISANQSQQNFNVQWNNPYQTRQVQNVAANPFMQSPSSSNSRSTNSTNPFM